MEIDKKLIRAKIQLQKEHPFFSYLVMNLKIKEDNRCESMGVDNRGNMFYNSKWINKLDEEELKGVLSHEVLHLALHHLIRGLNKNHEIYNIATDLVINAILKNNNFKLPQGLIPDYDDSFRINETLIIKELSKKTADEVYNELLKCNKENKNDKEGKEGKENEKGNGIKSLGKKRFDEHIFGNEKDLSKEKVKEIKDKWKKLLSESIVYSKQQGKTPSGMDRTIDLILNEKINWKALLYRYITNELPFDYTYNYPSKKSRATGIFMPSIKRENINVVVSVDTSASIGQDELSEFLNEIIGIAKSFNNLKMKLIVCDSEIHEVHDIENGNIDKIRNLKISGGGGTSHEPIYDYVQENLPNTNFIINFTDGYTNFNELNSNLKTIWVITSNGIDEDSIPFGEVISLK